MQTLIMLFGNKFAALGTPLGRVLGVDQDDGSASFFRFANRHADELIPSRVHDALSHAALVAFKIFIV
jgi:hypothetical protein